MQKKILIADDSRSFLMYIGLILKRLRFTVIPAQNGVEVLKFSKLSEPDLIILDVHMETMDGLTVLKYLKEDSQTSRIPVIIISTDATEGTMRKCKEAGCLAYLSKPVKIDKLHEAIQNSFFSSQGTSRKHMRVSVNKKVTVTYQGTDYQLYSEAISTGGMYIVKEEPFPVGSDINMKISLNKDTLFLKGTVIYIKELFGDLFKLPPGMAIQFKDVSTNDTRVLKCYIENILAEDIFESQEEGFIER